MIARTQDSRAKLAASLKQLTFLAAALYLGIGCYLGARIVIKNRDAAKNEASTAAANEQARGLKVEIDRAKHVNGPSAPTDLRAVAKLQSRLQESAAANACAVREFRASSDVAPYLTRFNKRTDATGWAQIASQFTLAGKPGDVVKVLQDLAKSDVPYEFDSVDFTRDKVDEAGDAIVLAKVSFRVLIRSTQGAA